MNHDQLYSIVVIVPHGLEPLCKEEALSLGATSATEKPGKVEIQAPLKTAYSLCLHSRFASRVLVVLTKFNAANREEFYKEAVQYAWEQEIPEGSTISIDCKIGSTRNTEIVNSMFGGMLLKDAICDRMREKTGRRPSVEPKLPDLRFALSIWQTICTISLDFSGEPLNKRGYRKIPTAAPLKENLAAAILKRAGWEKAAAEKRPFLDPMAGSGTFAIEALHMAANIPPQINRKFFGFLRWKKHKNAIWQTICEEAKRNLPEQYKKLEGLQFTAVEIDERAFLAAQTNIEAAGLTNFIKLIHADIFDLKPEIFSINGQAGFIAVNPPYGERIGEVREAEYLCRRIGTTFPTRFPGWKMAFLAGSKQLSIATGLRPYKTNPLKNGQIESVLACYDFADLEKETFRSEKEQQGQEMFLNRLKKNAKQLKTWLKNTGTQCYRLYDADMPEYAAAIDIYNTNEEGIHCVIAEYAPPPTIAQQTRSRRLNIIVDTVPSFLEIPADKVHLKVRKKQKGKEQYEKSRNQFNAYTVNEDGLKFRVDFDRYLDTGLFLDHRPVRKLIRQILLEKKAKRSEKTDKPLRFLNLFAYTCTASVYAAAAGAETISVDLSSTYLDWGKENIRLNRMAERNHKFFREDSQTFLANERRFFDLIYIDPPTFSNSKKTDKDFVVERDYLDLIHKAKAILAPEGEILFSNNFRKFRMDYTQLEDFEIKEISRNTIDPDFEGNRKIHQAWRLKLLPGRN